MVCGGYAAPQLQSTLEEFIFFVTLVVRIMLSEDQKGCTFLYTHSPYVPAVPYRAQYIPGPRVVMWLRRTK